MPREESEIRDEALSEIAQSRNSTPMKDEKKEGDESSPFDFEAMDKQDMTSNLSSALKSNDGGMLLTSIKEIVEEIMVKAREDDN